MIQLTAEELSLLNTPSFFEYKRSAGEKLKSLLETLKETLAPILDKDRLDAPPQLDTTRGQIAKGENYEGYPYALLDFPRYFSHTDIFTFRTLIWYGNDVIFSGVFKGEAVSRMKSRLLIELPRLSEKNYTFAVSDIWDWRKESEMPLSKLNDEHITRAFLKHDFLKLMHRLPISCLIQSETVHNELMSFYTDVLPIISRNGEEG